MTPIDVKVTWSKVKVKQLVFEKNQYLKIYFLIVTKFGTMVVPRKYVFPIDFQVM